MRYLSLSPDIDGPWFFFKQALASCIPAVPWIFGTSNDNPSFVPRIFRTSNDNPSLVPRIFRTSNDNPNLVLMISFGGSSDKGALSDH